MNHIPSPPASARRTLSRDVLCSTRPLSNDDRAHLFRDKLDGKVIPVPRGRDWLRLVVDAVGLVLFTSLALSWVWLMYVLMEVKP